MGSSYLCSRSELFRSLDLDTGIDPLFVGPPDGFMDWFDKVLPTTSLSVKNPRSIPRGSKFDLVLIWPAEGLYPGDDELGMIFHHSRNQDRIWVAIPVGAVEMSSKNEGGKINDYLEGPPILLSTDHEIFKLKIKASDFS